MELNATPAWTQVSKYVTPKQTYCHNHNPSSASEWSHCLRLSWREVEGGDLVLRCTRRRSCGVHAQSLGWRCWTLDAPGWLSPQKNSCPGCFLSHSECWECRRWASQGPEAGCRSRCSCWVWRQNKVSGGRSEARLNLRCVCHHLSLTFCDRPSCGWWWRGGPGWKCWTRRPQCQSPPPGRCSKRWRQIRCGSRQGHHTSARWNPASSYTCKTRTCSGTGLRWHRGSWCTHQHHSSTWTKTLELSEMCLRLKCWMLQTADARDQTCLLWDINNLVYGFELIFDIPVSLEACFTLTYWTIQTVDTLPAVFTGVISAVWTQLAPEFKRSLLKQPRIYIHIYIKNEARLCISDLYSVLN